MTDVSVTLAARRVDAKLKLKMNAHPFRITLLACSQELCNLIRLCGKPLRSALTIQCPAHHGISDQTSALRQRFQDQLGRRPTT